MTNTNASHIAVVLDASGSMSGIAKDTIGSLNGFVAQQRSLPGDVKFTLTLFNTEHRPVYSGAPLPSGDTITADTYKPEGGTALYDAVGQTIDNLGALFAAMPEQDRPGRVIVVILTDGEENSSKRYSQARIAEMIKRQRESYNWQFIFLGADLMAEQVAAAINIPRSSSMAYTASASGMRSVLLCTSAAVNSYCATGESVAFSAEERAENAPTP